MCHISIDYVWPMYHMSRIEIVDGFVCSWDGNTGTYNRHPVLELGPWTRARAAWIAACVKKQCKKNTHYIIYWWRTQAAIHTARLADHRL
jgi:hypothetical protein